MDDRIAEALRGLGPVGILAIVVILAGNLVVVPQWDPGAGVGPVVANAMARDRLRAAQELDRHPGHRHAFGSAFTLLMKVVVMPLLGAPPINQAYHYLAGNRAALPAALYAVIILRRLPASKSSESNGNGSVGWKSRIFTFRYSGRGGDHRQHAATLPPFGDEVRTGSLHPAPPMPSTASQNRLAPRLS
jgi:hypothetical protein